MDAGAVETIAKMQCKIDSYEYFLQNLNPAKRNVMVVKNEMRLLKQKRNVLQI